MSVRPKNSKKINGLFSSRDTTKEHETLSYAGRMSISPVNVSHMTKNWDDMRYNIVKPHHIKKRLEPLQQSHSL